MRKWSKNRAQTATELAVFGAVLLFVIGAIVRQALSFGHIQNQNLRALRMAMMMSYEHSTGLRSSVLQNDRELGNASRNFANVLLIEDRLSSDSAKYGALSRNPVFANAQAAHSRNLFMPVDSGEDYNLPMFDMFINGVHFPFTVANFKTVCLTEAEGNCPSPYNSADPRHVWLGSLDSNFWESTCVTRYPIFGGPQFFGCARLYAMAVNNPEVPSWCITDPCSCLLPVCSTSSTPHPWTPHPVANRFDLDRNGSTDVPSGIQSDFAWQWTLVSAFDGDEQEDNNTPTELLHGEHIAMGEQEEVEPANTVLDVDNDLKEERIVRRTLRHNNAGVILLLTVIDNQDGDFDFSYNTADYNRYQASLLGILPPAPLTARPEPGLLDDVSMYTRVRPGTYLEILEGNLVSPSGQVVRSVQRKDHIDIVQRIIQLSNDTGRFCTGTSVNTSTTVWVDTPNPVEVCASDCFTSANISRTCLDIDPGDLRIFVRSRVLDSFGHQWVTDISSDDYVNFVVPTP